MSAPETGPESGPESATSPAPASAPDACQSDHDESPATPSATQRQREIGGPSGLEPTRYGDWERKGRCIDF